MGRGAGSVRQRGRVGVTDEEENRHNNVLIMSIVSIVPVIRSLNSFQSMNYPFHPVPLPRPPATDPESVLLVAAKTKTKVLNPEKRPVDSTS